MFGHLRAAEKATTVVMVNMCTMNIYLDSREGDSRGGVGADHQRHDGGA